jgi:polar amino acid transport system permease protein|tara:strand:+ start:469 stop:1332 length:864 start_codon:yes stop_codon:yes gene_type:complete
MTQANAGITYLASLLGENKLRHPKDPASSHIARSIWQILQAILVFGIIAWLIYAGAAAMEYRWQWYRVGPFFYRIVDGEFIAGPLIRGIIVTLQLAGVSSVLAILIGAFTAIGRMSNSIAGRSIATTYLEIIRNTPLLVQLFMFYFVLAPIFGIDRFWAGVLCLAAFEGSFAAEIIRGGIQAVDRGQYEAADATGLSKFDKYFCVILPQALPLILPPLTGLLISLIKHSAIVSVIAVAELTTEGLNLISDTYMAFEIWFIVAGMYLVLTTSLSVLVNILEVRMNRAR